MYGLQAGGDGLGWRGTSLGDIRGRVCSLPTVPIMVDLSFQSVVRVDPKTFIL